MENSVTKSNEEEGLYLKSDKIEFMSYDEVIEERFESLLSRYQIGLEASMKGKDFIFNGDNFHSY